MLTKKAKHLSDLPDKGEEFMQGVMSIISPLCPNCRLELLGFICGTAVKQIHEKQRKDYLRELIWNIMMAGEMLPGFTEQNEEDETDGETIH